MLVSARFSNVVSGAAAELKGEKKKLVEMMMIYGRNIDFARLFRLYLFFSLLIRHDVVERRVWSSSACGL